MINKATCLIFGIIYVLLGVIDTVFLDKTETPFTSLGLIFLTLSFAINEVKR